MKEEGPEEEEEDEDDEAFAHQTSGYAASHARGSWLVGEEKGFALFLASDPQKNDEGLNIFQQYQRSASWYLDL